MRHPYWGESVARPHPERSESSSCTKSATACLRAPKSVLRRYSPRRDPHILPTFLQVDSTHLQVRRVGTTALARPLGLGFVGGEGEQ